MHFQYFLENKFSERGIANPYSSPRQGLAEQLTLTQRVAGRGHYPPGGRRSSHCRAMEVKQYSLEACSRAIRMLQAGKTQRGVASHLGVPVLTIKRWWKNLRRQGESQIGRGQGAPPAS